ncbi:MAG: methyltransferase domain-containing protein [Rhodomicrobium sp.]
MHIQLPAIAGVQHSFDAWRAEHPQLDVMLGRKTPPARALRFLGLQQWSEGRLEAAIRLLSAAAALEPDSAAIWGDLGGAYYAMNRPQEARACMATSLDKDSMQPSAWLLLGTIDSGTQNDAEAEFAFLRALSLDPQLAAASAGLGLMYFRQRRFKNAADRLGAAVLLGSQIPLVRACLGQALYFLGEFSKAAGILAIEASLNPGDPGIAKKFALNRFMDAILHEDVQTALAIYAGIAGPHAEDPVAVTRTAFHLLSSYGHRDAAIKLGRERLSWAPDDPVQSYLLAALAQEPLSRAPEDYIVEYFNLFAETFDAQLVDVLGYRTPEDLHSLLANTLRTFPQVLDLGCGTGLAGSLLRSLAGTLAGVDLSTKMLEKAAARRVYDYLIEGEIGEFLNRQPDSFDLIFAADVLIYFGDLAQVMRSAAQSLKPGGLFAFSIEHARSNGYALLPTGRFAHHPSYVEELANDDFLVLEKMPKTIRLEACRPVDGILYILQRR